MITSALAVYCPIGLAVIAAVFVLAILLVRSVPRVRMFDSPEHFLKVWHPHVKVEHHSDAAADHIRKISTADPQSRSLGIRRPVASKGLLHRSKPSHI